VVDMGDDDVIALAAGVHDVEEEAGGGDDGQSGMSALEVGDVVLAGDAALWVRLSRASVISAMKSIKKRSYDLAQTPAWRAIPRRVRRGDNCLNRRQPAWTWGCTGLLACYDGFTIPPPTLCPHPLHRGRARGAHIRPP
jgi:hypothetical protein